MHPSPVRALVLKAAVRPALLLVACLLSVSCTNRKSTGALTNFEGAITLHTIEGAKESDIVVTAKGQRLRIDPPTSAPPPPNQVTLGHIVYDRVDNVAKVFFDSTKEWRQMDLSKRITPDNVESPPIERGPERVVAGIACRQETIKGEGGRQWAVCLADGLAYLEIFRVQLGPKGVESALAREFREHATFPMDLSEVDAQGKEVAHLQVTKVDRHAVDDSVFSVPDGYKKVDPHFDQAPPSRADKR